MITCCSMPKQLDVVEGDMIKYIMSVPAFIIDTQGNKIPLHGEDVLIFVGYVNVIEELGIRFTKTKWLFNERIFHFCVSDEAAAAKFFKKVKV